MMGKKLQSGMKVNILPTEIEEIILSKVPVKTILRFMSVCKSWYSLFLNPYFINIHSKNSQNNSNNLLLMHRRKNKQLVVMDSCSSVVRSRLSVRPRRTVNSQLGNGEHDYGIVGSHNGIVCIHGICRYHNDGGTLHEYFFLWNPALKITKKIMNRVGHLRGQSSEELFVGFGFDRHSNDYKVIRFCKAASTVLIKVEIYSLCFGSWRIVNVAPPHYLRRFCSYESITHALGVYLNGAHHWDVHSIESETVYSAIVSFDMGEQVFKDIVIPNECMERELFLFNYNDSLGILMDCGTTAYSACIWVMKDYGKPESWTKLRKIDIRQPLGSLKFLGIIETNNEVILFRHIYSAKQSFVFDIDKLQVKDTSSFITNTEVLKDTIQVMTYRESLLLLNAPNIIHYQ